VWKLIITKCRYPILRHPPNFYHSIRWMHFVRADKKHGFPYCSPNTPPGTMLCTKQNLHYVKELSYTYELLWPSGSNEKIFKWPPHPVFAFLWLSTCTFQTIPGPLFFLCNTLFYWLKNWGDFVSPEKNGSVTYMLKCCWILKCHRIYSAETNHGTCKVLLHNIYVFDIIKW
jgi:hypothetical protein